MKKSSLKNKFLTLAVLATVMGGSVFMPRASAATGMNWNLAAPTGSTYKTSITTTGVSQAGSYRTNIDKTTVSQATKNGDITLGNQINFGTYQQSLKTGSFSAPSTSIHNDARYSASGATFNTDPVAWIVVEKDTGDTSGRYTLVSTKVLDGGMAWDTAGTYNWGNLSAAASEANKNLRAFLNNTMFNSLVKGMSDAQKGLIQSSNITTYGFTSGSPGSNGWDNSTYTSGNG